jgi:hypothetical protein
MGIRGRINPNPTRSIKTVKKIIEMDAFFMGIPALRNNRPSLCNRQPRLQLFKFWTFFAEFSYPAGRRRLLGA